MRLIFWRQLGSIVRLNITHNGISGVTFRAFGLSYTIGKRGDHTARVHTPLEGLRFEQRLKRANHISAEERDRPYCPRKYPRRKLEALVIEQQRQIETLQRQLSKHSDTK